VNKIEETKQPLTEICRESSNTAFERKDVIFMFPKLGTQIDNSK